MIPVGNPSASADVLFLQISVSKLRDDFYPRLRKAVEHLSDAEIWERSDDHVNAVGNILLHMAGNLRQWIVSGLGSAHDVRVRSDEFSTRGGKGREELLALVSSTVDEAVVALERLDPTQLSKPRTVQGYHVTGLEAVYHAVEHFSYHLGQVIHIVKATKKVDLRFYNL